MVYYEEKYYDTYEVPSSLEEWELMFPRNR